MLGSVRVAQTLLSVLVKLALILHCHRNRYAEELLHDL